MKARLEFNLPEDHHEHYSALNGSRYRSLIFEIDNKLRVITKYGVRMTRRKEHKTILNIEAECAQTVRDWILQELDGLDL